MNSLPLVENWPMDRPPTLPNVHVVPNAHWTIRLAPPMAFNTYFPEMAPHRNMKECVMAVEPRSALTGS